MRTDELVTAVRLSSFIDDSHADFTAARIALELNDIMLEVFGKCVVGSRGGYWLKRFLTNVTANKRECRIPARATVGGLESVEIQPSSGGTFTKLLEVSAEDAAYYEGPSTTTGQPGTATGTPRRFFVRGDQVIMLPTPDATYIVRMHYYLRPSRLVTQQSSTLGGGTDRGRITTFDTTARTITVNAVPFDQEIAVPAAITSGSNRIDVVHPDGWHEVAMAGAIQTLAGSVFTISGSTSMDEIAIGDYVRVQEQTDWPCLPDEFHRTLADAAATVILTSIGDREKASFISSKVANDIERLATLLEPRIKSSVRKLKPRNTFLRGSSGSRWPARYP